MTDTILSQSEEEKCWSLYLAVVSNPFAEAGSFDDFMKKNKQKKAEPQIKKFDSKMQIMKAQKILSVFKPLQDRGGEYGASRSIQNNGTCGN